MSDSNSIKSLYGLFTLIIALYGIYLLFFRLPTLFSMFEKSKSLLQTFELSFIFGMMGAVVYILLIILTEKNLNVFDNGIVDNLALMCSFVIISGGVVAAVTQVTAGVLASNNIHTVFMLGFGWQGAMAGVVATGTRAKAASDFEADLKAEKEKTEIIKKHLNEELEEVYNTVNELMKEDEGSS